MDEITQKAIEDLRTLQVRDRNEADHTRRILLKLVRRLVDRGALSEKDAVDMIVALGKGKDFGD